MWFAVTLFVFSFFLHWYRAWTPSCTCVWKQQWQSTQNLKETWCACTRDNRAASRTSGSLRMETSCSPEAERSIKYIFMFSLINFISHCRCLSVSLLVGIFIPSLKCWTFFAMNNRLQKCVKYLASTILRGCPLEDLWVTQPNLE